MQDRHAEFFKKIRLAGQPKKKDGGRRLAETAAHKMTEQEQQELQLALRHQFEDTFGCE